MSSPNHLWITLTVTLALSFAADVSSRTPEGRRETATSTAEDEPDSSGRLECSVQGTPEDRPDDLYIRNIGKTTIAKGTMIDWAAGGSSLAGVVALPVELTPGAGTFVKDVVKGGLEPGHECVCRVASRSRP